jgi:hypothetical protein
MMDVLTLFFTVFLFCYVLNILSQVFAVSCILSLPKCPSLNEQGQTCILFTCVYMSMADTISYFL